MQTSVFQILSKTGEILTSRIGLLLGLWATYFAMQIALFVVLAAFVGASALSSLSAGSPGALGVGMILLIVLAYLAYFLVAFAQAGSLTAMASPLQSQTFGEAFNAGVRSALPMLGALVLMLVGYFIAALVIGLLAAVLSFLGSAGPVILMILLIPAALYLMTRLCLIYAVISVDRVGNPIKAIARGWDLTRNNVQTILGVIIIFVVALIVVGGLLFVPLFTSMNSVATGGVPNMGGMMFAVVGFFVFSIALSIIGAALFSVIHSELSDTSAGQASAVFS